MENDQKCIKYTTKSKEIKTNYNDKLLLRLTTKMKQNLLFFKKIFTIINFELFITHNFLIKYKHNTIFKKRKNNLPQKQLFSANHFAKSTLANTAEKISPIFAQKN